VTPAERRALADRVFMREALALAERARGHTSPNPMVGCVIVRGGWVLARGHHRRAGLPHAEVDALSAIGGRAPGATAYVTLEPCDHVGRTGRCTEALIAAGVARVVAGMRDPNPRVDGRGIRRLRRAGISVEVGVLGEECRALNRAYTKWITTGRPLVTLKAAVTLDGRIAARTGDSRWVSGPLARQIAHRLRSENDAILVGARTVARDDPQLTTRLHRGRDARRVILDGRLSVPARARALPGALVFTCAADPTRTRRLTARGAEVVRLGGRGGRVPLPALLRELGRREITSLLVEGGGEVHGQLLSAGLVDEVVLFVAPKLVGAGGVPLLAVPGPDKMADAWLLKGMTLDRAGEDLVVRGQVVPRRP
jgi:diaminohydroxyphosphoribosylaminopyrimidine deaminase/5-amino-6-(5-phosphoribosylamino)uracil reductase